MKNITILIILFLSLIIPSVQAREDQGSDTAEIGTTTLWKITDDDNTVYLLGSIHVLTEESHPLPEPMQEAYDEADSIIVEVSQAEMGPDVAAMLLKKGQYQGGSTLQDNVSKETYEALQAHLQSMNLSPKMLDPYKPWFAGLMLAAITLETQGYTQESGVEAYFEEQAGEDGKPVQSLETAQEQIELLSSASEKFGEEMLLQMIRESEALIGALDDMVTYWQSGEIRKLAAILNAELSKYPELREKLLVQRNKNWIPQIVERIEGDEDTLVIVGAGHLIGEDSVVELLREKDYEVTQL
jgi:hypothetical protein